MRAEPPQLSAAESRRLGHGPFRLRSDDHGRMSVVPAKAGARVPPRGPQPVPAPRDLAEARVRDLMRTDPICCSPRATVAEALALLARHGVHCMLVEPADVNSGTSWTLMSDLDLLGAVLARGGEEPVGHFTGAPVVHVQPDDSIASAARLMVELAARHLVVREPLGVRPVGILSTMDLAALAASLAGAEVIRRR